MSGLEMLKNSGKEQIIDLLYSRIKNAERTIMNNIAEDMYSDGSADAGKQMDGLQAQVSDAGTGTVGGIDSSTWDFWQNKVYDFSVAGVTPSSSTITAAMNTLWLQLTRNQDKPDLIVADNTYFQYYWESLQAIQRIGTAKEADAGFTSLKYMSADVVPGEASNGHTPANKMYFLNTDYIHYRPHRDRDMVPLDPDRYSTNQDAVVKLIGWAGNLTCSNRSLQGVITP